ncbi:MAG: hypothetical protein NVS9B9_27720 [Ktedonobacteraceae bacterium]
METHFYQTQQLELPRIAQAIVFEYQAKGYQVQQFGNPDQVTVQLKKEDTLRAITGFNKALAVSLQRINGGTLVHVGAQDWTDQIAVGAVGLVIHPLLVTAAIGAVSQNNVVHDILLLIDNQVRQQQPNAQMGIPPFPPTGPAGL